MVAFNRKLEPSLLEEGSTGVVAQRLSAEAATACAAYLQEHWIDGRLRLAPHVTARGYTTYGKVLEKHDAQKQQR